MTGHNDDFDLIRGTGNAFADQGLPDADMEQVRAVLAAAIGKAMTAQGIGPREAARRTGVAASDLSRIRNARLERFTIDRLMTILGRMGQEVRVSVEVGARDSGSQIAGLDFGNAPPPGATPGNQCYVRGTPSHE
jgi:predicted XRE-type DNA-binding protein